jgi:hypothetical protein
MVTECMGVCRVSCCTGRISSLKMLLAHLFALRCVFTYEVITFDEVFCGLSLEKSMATNGTCNDATTRTTPAISPHSFVEVHRQELERARAEYERISERLEEIKEVTNSLSQALSQQESRRDQLIARRDELNRNLRDKRKEITELQKLAENTKAELCSLEAVARGVRRDAAQAKSKAEQAQSIYDASRSEQNRLESSLEETGARVRLAESTLDAAGGMLMPGDIASSTQERKTSRNNPWIAGSFYLFALVVIAALFAVISTSIPWYALIVVFIAGILAVSIVGAFQLRNDESLSEQSFLKLMLETFKHLPLLHKDSATPTSQVLRTGAKKP